MHKSDNTSEILNKSQFHAAKHVDGPMLVIAGAGTGKTRVIIERISHLVLSGISPKHILALTFTEKAATEMVDRTNTLLRSYQTEMPIMTFNAFGESLLRRYSSDVGLSRNFKLMNESAQIVFLREHIDELALDYFSPISNPDGLLSDIAAYFSLLKQNVITADEYESFVKEMPESDAAELLDKNKHLELSQAYKRYLTLCKETAVIDYDDQLFLLVELLQKRPNILRQVTAQYKYIMVDEFQDTNLLQSVMIDMIAGSQKNLFVVGDDDQSIYGWRGATLANILDFKVRYPETAEVTLVDNYRNTQEILDSAYKLIQNNNPHRLEAQLNINKRLHSDRHGKSPQIHVFESIDNEISWIIEDISRRIESGATPGSIAVLARRNATIQLVKEQMDLSTINYSVAGQRYDLFREPVVRTFLEALKSACDPLHSLSLYHTLAGPLFALPNDELSRLNRTARQEHKPLLEVIESEFSDEGSDIKKSTELIKSWHAKSSIVSVGQLAYEILEQSGYKNRLYETALAAPDVVASGVRLGELFRNFKDFELIALQPTAIQYVQALPALMAGGTGGEDDTLDLSGETVNLLTIHRSKGLEWSTVYIVDCTEGSFPLRESHRGISLPTGLKDRLENAADSHIAEERRLMYVAMTRAKNELIFTRSEHHSGISTRKLSRFIDELQPDENSELALGTQAKIAKGLLAFAPDLNSKIPLPSSILRGNEVTLTISQVQCYLECPLNFYYCYVLDIPQEPSSVLAYGSVMHSLVEAMNRSLMTGKLIELEKLSQQLYESLPSSGYISKGHRDRVLKQAVSTIKQLHKRFKDNLRVPLAVEESFCVKLPEFNMSIKGRFDAVFKLENGIEIVDYKTGTSASTPEKAKQRATSSQQLTMYALAWQMMHDELPVLTTLDFIDSGLKGSVKKTPRGIEGMQKRLQMVADGIRTQDFTPAKDHSFCKHPSVSE